MSIAKRKGESLMETFSFTLRLNRPVEEVELDRLFEAGLDDSAPEGELLHVDRAAGSLLEAVWSAARQVATVSSDLRAERLVWGDLVTLREIAQRLGRSYESVRLLVAGRRGPGGFPPPELDAGRTQIWSWPAVAGWFQAYAASPSSAVESSTTTSQQVRMADLLVQMAATTAGDPQARTWISDALHEVA